MKALLFQGLGRRFIENQGALVLVPELLFVSSLLIFLHQWAQFLTGGDILYQHGHFSKSTLCCFQRGGRFGADGGDLGHPAFQIRVTINFMLRQKVQRPGSLFQVVELCPLLVPCGLLGLDTVFQINPQRNFAGFFGLPLRKPPFDALGDGFFGVGFAQRFAAGEPPLSGRTERNILAPLDFIALLLQEPQKIVKILGLRDGCMRDITFKDSVGFPINRVEKIGYIRSLLEQEQPELPPEEKAEKSAVPSALRHNYRITEDTLGVGGAKEKFHNNMAAINLLHELELENRLATPEEQETLSKYVGWGGQSMAFDENNAAWANEFQELYASLSPEEYRAAMESTLTAFYTPPVVIKGMYEALDRLGFSEGSILEPSCGTGNFFGLLPDSMAGSKLHGVEIDELTGRIAGQLYQKANIAVQGFEETKLPDDHFDVVIGNVPFGDFKVNDSRYNAQKFLIHDYFFAKALDKVRTGGVVAFITSKGTMDKASPEVRKYIAQRAELLGAIRLPDNTFRANAGTEVTSDILFLQKRDRITDIEPDWVHLDTDENGITMNSYFVQHPEMILGEMKMESTRFGMDSACKAYQDIPLSELLHNAVQNIRGEIPEYMGEIDEISDEQDEVIPADPNVRNFSFALVDGKVYFRENDIMTPAAASMTAENRIKGLIEIRDCVRKLIEYQTEDYPEEMIQTEQENLNRLYDAFSKKYGLINRRGNYLAFASDESYFLLCSLEVLDDEGNFKRKADMFTKRTIKPHREITSVEMASEALALSIGEKARVDSPNTSSL